MPIEHVRVRTQHYFLLLSILEQTKKSEYITSYVFEVQLIQVGREIIIFPIHVVRNILFSSIIVVMESWLN